MDTDAQHDHRKLYHKLESSDLMINRQKESAKDGS
jgi:hypothetical protein